MSIRRCSQYSTSWIRHKLRIWKAVGGSTHPQQRNTYEGISGRYFPRIAWKLSGALTTGRLGCDQCLPVAGASAQTPAPENLLPARTKCGLHGDAHATLRAQDHP